jgi:hypothetical protein
MIATPTLNATATASRLGAHLRAHSALITPGVPLAVSGRLVRVSGLIMEATGLRLPLGSVCRVRDGEEMTEAEVVGFSKGRLFLMPTGGLQGLSPGRTRAVCPWATPCWAAWWTRPASRWTMAGRCLACIPSRWRAIPSTPWTASRCASRWTPACAPSMRC